MKPNQLVHKSAPGFVERGILYTRNEVKSRMGWKDAGFREACRRGLKTFQRGKCVYVLGEDIITYITDKDNCKGPKSF